MNETLTALEQFLVAQGSSPRVVVWAHNSHLGDASATEMAARGELVITSYSIHYTKLYDPVFATILITLGLLFVIEQVCTAIWGYDLLPMGDPWGIETVSVGGAVLRVLDLWSIAAAGLVLGLFFVFFRRSTIGIAMRARNNFV